MQKDKKPDKKKTAEKKLNRRQFLVGGSAAIAAGAIAATTGVKTASAEPQEVSYPASTGYLVYDSKKCMGCTTCILACSLTHYGAQSLSLSRIQIIQDSFGKTRIVRKQAE